jgi:hypothetical protein
MPDPPYIYAPTTGHSIQQTNSNPFAMRTGISWPQAWAQNMGGIQQKYPNMQAYINDMKAQRLREVGNNDAKNSGDVTGAQITQNYYYYGFDPQTGTFAQQPRPTPAAQKPPETPPATPPGRDPEITPRGIDPFPRRTPTPPTVGEQALGTATDVAATAATGGLNWLLPVAGGILGALGSVPAEPQFNRNEHYNYWDQFGRDRYGKIWGESERDPYQDPTGYFRSAQRASLTAMNSAIENDAQKQFAQAQAGAGQQLATIGNQRALASMAPAMFAQTGENLRTGYNIRNQSAGFREDFNQRGISDAYRWHIDRIDRGMHPEQTTGWGAVSSVLGGAASGFGSGLDIAKDIWSMDLTEQLLTPKGAVGAVQEALSGGGSDQMMPAPTHIPIDGQPIYGPDTTGTSRQMPNTTPQTPLAPQGPAAQGNITSAWNRTGWFGGDNGMPIPNAQPMQLNRTQPTFQQAPYHYGQARGPMQGGPQPIQKQLNAFDAMNVPGGFSAKRRKTFSIY